MSPLESDIDPFITNDYTHPPEENFLSDNIRAGNIPAENESMERENADR